MGNIFKSDIHDHYKRQLTQDMLNNTYYVIAICQVRTAKESIETLGISYIDYYEINGLSPNNINLYELLPFSIHQLNIPILFFVENIMDLNKNKHWFKTRKCVDKDLVLDTYGNLLYVSQI